MTELTTNTLTAFVTTAQADTAALVQSVETGVALFSPDSAYGTKVTIGIGQASKDAGGGVCVVLADYANEIAYPFPVGVSFAAIVSAVLGFGLASLADHLYQDNTTTLAAGDSLHEDLLVVCLRDDTQIQPHFTSEQPFIAFNVAHVQDEVH